MHPRAIELASKHNTKIVVASSEFDIPGTIINKGEYHMEEQSVTGLAIDNDELIITIRDIPFDLNITSQFFSQFANKSINIDMISQSAPIKGLINISFTAPIQDLEDAMKILADFEEKYPGIGVVLNEN